MHTLLRLQKAKIIVILFLGLLVLGVLQLLPSNSTSTTTNTYAQEQPPPPDAPIIPAPVDEKRDAELMNQKAEQVAQNGIVTNLSGLETRGALITIAGKQIKLPDDIEMLGVTVALNCMVVPEVPGNCPIPPLVALKKMGNPPQFINVEISTGMIWPVSSYLKNAPDEYLKNFSFLTDVLGKDKVVDVLDLERRLLEALQPQIEEARKQQ